MFCFIPQFLVLYKLYYYSSDLYSRAVLDKYLSRALGVPLSKDGRLSPIDKKKYVLTLDFTLKMLNIHERYECGVPVIIEGETGVGKTALIEMLSELWNYSWVAQLDVMKDHIVHLMHRELEGIVCSSCLHNVSYNYAACNNSHFHNCYSTAIDRDTVDDSQHSVCVEALCNLRNGEEVTEEMFDTFAQLSDSKDGSGHFYSVLKRPLLKLEEDLIFSMLNLKLKHGEKPADIFTAMKTEDCSKVRDILAIVYVRINFFPRSLQHIFCTLYSVLLSRVHSKK